MPSGTSRPELKDWEAKILGADERAKDLERDLFAHLREKVAEWVEPVQRTALAVAAVDVLSTLAEVASANDYARPRVDEGVRIDIAEGRHPRGSSSCCRAAILCPMT